MKEVKSYHHHLQSSGAELVHAVLDALALEESFGPHIISTEIHPLP